tara:strand:+ start:416 stop:1234 length:819 start_codon:yes stop_codon:yes gene_type:complete
MNEKILLIGCGNLGNLLLKTWLDRKKEIKVVENNLSAKRRLIKKYLNCEFYSDLSKVKIEDFNIVVLCVKPNDSKKIIKAISGSLKKTQCFVSLVAGLKIKSIYSLLNNNNIFRIMPNIFASVNSSSTAIFCNSSVQKNFKNKVEKLFEYIGKTIWLEKENDLDFFTALYGGGPAYIFSFLDILTRISEEKGLSHENSRSLVLELIFGTANYLKNIDKKKSFNSMLKIVASRGGTTEEALKHLNKRKSFFNLINSAVKKASLKSKKISKIFD